MMPTRIMSKGTARRLALIQRLTGFHGDGKDVTDPRDLYSILALAESKRLRTCVNVPLLVNESRIQEKINQEIKIRVKGYQPDKRPQTPPAHHQSSLELYDSVSAEIPTLTLVRQSSSLEDLTTLRRKNEKSQKARKSSLSFDNLPQLFEKTLNVTFKDSAALVPVEGLDAKEIADSSNIVLPKVPKVLEKTLPITKPAKAPVRDGVEPEGLGEDPRLRGVPSDLRGRTKQILMEETFREKLRARGLGLHRNRTLFPREQQGKASELKAYDLYPDKYWELREESVPNPRDLEADMINRDTYRMKQRSMLQLKAIECDSKSKTDRSPSEKSTTIRVNRKPKLLLDEPKPDEDPLSVSPITKLMLGPITYDPVVADPDRDSVCGPPNSRKLNRTQPPYYLTDEPLPNSINTFPKYTQVLSTPRPRYLPPTSIVNLTIDQDTPRQRKPKHIVENLQRQESRCKESNPQETELRENTCRLPLVHGNSSTSLALSARETADSKNRLLLTGFRKLEVFGETNSDHLKGDQAMVVSEPYRYRPQCHSPVYKLDLRNYPPSGNMIEALMALNQQNTQQGTDNSVSLKFKDGQVVISKLPVAREPHSSRAAKSGREVISKS